MSLPRQQYITAIKSYCINQGINKIKLKTALIDMDGVLYDSMKYHAKAWHKMITELGINCNEEEFFLYEGMTGKATINLIFQREYRRNASKEEIDTLYSRKAKYFIAYGQKETMPGAKEMLLTLKNANINRVLVTGSAQNSLLSKIDQDFPSAFLPENRITALDVSNGKPDPEPYLKGLKKANAKCTEAIVIENAPLGVTAGHNAGCFTIGITTGPIPANDLYSSGADIVFPSMLSFAETLPELIKLFSITTITED